MQARLSEWNLLAPAIEVYNPAGDKPLLALRFRLQRRWHHFAWNHMVLSGLLSTLGFCTFALDADEFARRSSITLVLLMTVTASKFLIDEGLPKISYLTTLDHYILRCIAMLSVIIIENTFVHVLTFEAWSYDEQGSADIAR